jgi:hypothetical protein
MKIPREFNRELLAFIASELTASVHPPIPIELAKSCGGFCLRWFGLMDLPSTFKNEEVRVLVSWSERLGKHVGEFFLNHKEG